MKRKLDTRAVGLDVGLAFVRWLTGAENLHYGDWTGLEPVAANLRRAQDAYTERLFGYLPEGRQRILDIGGGAGETARKLCELGHEVEIVVPSALLAERCRANAPAARVHETTFEDYAGAGGFDLCLFSESFQYIPLEVGLSKAAGLLKPGGHVILADCFRTETYMDAVKATVGGGHPLRLFRPALAESGLEVLAEEDITGAVAPSVDLEQELFNVFGLGIRRIGAELEDKRPRSHWLVTRALRLVLNERRRVRLAQRLFEKTRTAEVFAAHNRYLIVKLRRPA